MPPSEASENLVSFILTHAASGSRVRHESIRTRSAGRCRIDTNSLRRTLCFSFVPETRDEIHFSCHVLDSRTSGRSREGSMDVRSQRERNVPSGEPSCASSKLEPCIQARSLAYRDGRANKHGGKKVPELSWAGPATACTIQNFFQITARLQTILLWSAERVGIPF